jgi:hypothetical protein
MPEVELFCKLRKGTMKLYFGIDPHASEVKGKKRIPIPAIKADRRLLDV